MSDSQDSLIAQLETYSQSARANIDHGVEPAIYWKGVLFGVELALLEARKGYPVPTSTQSDDIVGKLVFDRLEDLIVMCKLPIRRDLLEYNAKVVRYELLRAIRQQTDGGAPSDYERQANPDNPLTEL
jgi:hypothetical protein